MMNAGVMNSGAMMQSFQQGRVCVFFFSASAAMLPPFSEKTHETVLDCRIYEKP